MLTKIWQTIQHIFYFKLLCVLSPVKFHNDWHLLSWSNMDLCMFWVEKPTKDLNMDVYDINYIYYNQWFRDSTHRNTALLPVWENWITQSVINSISHVLKKDFFLPTACLESYLYMYCRKVSLIHIVRLEFVSSWFHPLFNMAWAQLRISWP